MSDVSVVQGAVQAATQNAVVATTEVLGKGGFSVHPTIGELIEFQVTGLLVVFVVLGGLTLICMLTGWLLKIVAPEQYYGKKKVPAAVPVPAAAPARAPAPAAPPVAATIHPGLSDDKLLVLLAIAASEGLGQAVSVVKFRPADQMDWTWSVQGRVGLHSHSSHKI